MVGALGVWRNILKLLFCVIARDNLSICEQGLGVEERERWWKPRIQGLNCLTRGLPPQPLNLVGLCFLCIFCGYECLHESNEPAFLPLLMLCLDWKI